MRRLLGTLPVEEGTTGPSLEDGLPAVLALEEKRWLEEALRRYPDLSRAELAAKLRISESALYKKLRSYGITARP